ncbi:hypothetical protein L596_016244 [Steinernema carpocapsae]|nr:hypothetical protein L596_016244 [Steinernema carpocapsae]
MEESDPELYFIGASTQVEAERLVKEGDFRLYYKLPQIEKCDLPVELQLYIVYRSSFGRAFHYPVVTISDQPEGKRYRVLYGDPRSQSFFSIQQLVNHHRTFSYRCNQNEFFETFPVWKNSLVPDGCETDSIH